MWARAAVTEPLMAMPTTAACTARARRNVFIFANPQMFLICREAAWLIRAAFGHAATVGASAPVRPGFEEGDRVADDRDRRRAHRRRLCGPFWSAPASGWRRSTPERPA